MEPIWRHARKLRRNATDAEVELWRHLKGRRFDGHKFRRQFPIAGYVADFACVEAKLVIELDGGQHLEAQHYDEWRTRRMNTNGYRVLRFWNDDVLLRPNLVLEDILRHLRERSR
ncbi:endonuclease domain-containing protein [Lysobacter auxotrophicus]|uniref:Endonuclease domain-containing protein n=2 Tax=Lysobacter auxotrophicus TaxID=2992573 RepID=A0ABN6UPT4_9GAMM|nr:endonuclease domain-containing protein [Lysobacter auxotrophicus]